MTRLPLDFPPLRELAERAEKEHHAMVTRIALDSGTGPTLPWALYRTGAGAAWGIDVRRRLLSDLTRPESQAVWLPWLATQIGWTESEHTPTWCYRYPRQAARDRDGAPMHEDLPAAWLLLREDGECMAFCLPDPEWIPDGWRAIPGLDVSGPEARTAALALAILTVGDGR